MSRIIYGKAVPTYIAGSGAGKKTQGVNRPVFQGTGSLRPSFWLPLTDSGAGLVNTAPRIAGGSYTATFARASVAWTKLASGLWKQVATGTARSSYLGATTAVGAYGGYFAEGAATQLVTPTASIRDMTDASWVKSNTTAAKTATGIDGVANSASTVTASADAGTILQTLTAAASSRTYSCWIKRRTGTGTITLQQGATTLDVTASINSSTYTRVSLTASVLNVAFGIALGTNTDAIDVDFNQFEAGTLATSPLDAAGAGVRAADNLTYTTAGNLSGLTGTAYGEITLPALIAGGQSAIGDANGDLNPNVAGTVRLFDGTYRLGNAISASASPQKIAWAWGGTASQTALSGTASSVLAFDGDMNFGATFGVGAEASSALPLYGCIKNVKIYRPAFSGAALARLTT